MSDVRQINALHERAMEAAGMAFRADLHGDYVTAQSLYRKAYELEREAALLLLDDPKAEPTRSILLRSAASLAADCHEHRDAERLVAIALAGDPPSHLAEELRDLLETVYFSRHLSLRGLELDPGEFQMSLSGSATGFGVIESAQFLRRTEVLEKLLVRTAERLRGMSFRESGSPSKEAMHGLEIFFSAARAASYAIAIRLGRPQRQKILPGFVGPREVVDEFLNCMACFDARDRDALRGRIEVEAYFNNFTALARRIAPDGIRVRTVGFTSIRGDETKNIALSQTAPFDWRRTSEVQEPTVILVGAVRSADEKTSRKYPVFGVEGDNGKTQNVAVPPGMLQDIVKPYWGERVRVSASRKGTRLELLDIERDESGPSDSISRTET